MTDHGSAPSCLLIVPPFQSGEGSILRSFDYTMPPLGLLSIAAWLRQLGVRISLLDFTVEGPGGATLEDSLKAHLRENGPPNWVGISICSPVAGNAYTLGKLCKEVFRDCKVVLGGPHVTAVGKTVLEECLSADAIIAGEGEYALGALILKNDITAPNLITRQQIGSKELAEGPSVDLAQLPMPAYDLLKFDRYVPPPSSLKSRRPGIGIITTRGCPFKCTFCTKIAGSKLRLTPVPQVIEQLKYLKERFKIRQFHFYDDTISCNRNYILDLCRSIVQEDLRVHWSAFARVDTVDAEVLAAMKKAGCFIIMYGIESMDDAVLKSYQKGITVQQSITALEETRRAGIESRISVIIGSPYDNWETVKKTKQALLKLRTDFLQVFIAIPMPGSQFYREALAEGRVLSQRWEDFNLSKVLYRHPIFTEKELFKLQRQYYLAFYLRPKMVFRYLMMINSWNALRNVMRGFKGFLKIVSA